MSSKTPKNSNMLKWLCLQAALLIILIAIPICVVASVDIIGDISTKSNEQEIVINTNIISGKLWDDANGDGAYDEDEELIANCLVSLYMEGDVQNAVQTAFTDAGGQYRFTDIDPGSYAIGVSSANLGEAEYFIPIAGVASGNKFNYLNERQDVMFALSEPMEIGKDTLLTDIDVAMRRIHDQTPARGDLDTDMIYGTSPLDLGGNATNDPLPKDLNKHSAHDSRPDLGEDPLDDLLHKYWDENAHSDPLPKDLNKNSAHDPRPDWQENALNDPQHKNLGENQDGDPLPKDLNKNSADDPHPDWDENAHDDPQHKNLGENQDGDPLPQQDLDTNTGDNPLHQDSDENAADDPPPALQDLDMQLNSDPHEIGTGINEISGKIWRDTNLNGIYDESIPIEGYSVYLFDKEDTQNPVDSVQTDADGDYSFKDMQSGTYVVGIGSEIKDGIEYLIPIVGITEDNKFISQSAQDSESVAYSELIEILTNTVVADINAAMRASDDMQSPTDPSEGETVIGPRKPRSDDTTTSTAQKNAYLNDASTANNGTSDDPAKVAVGDKITYEIVVNKPTDVGGQYDVLFVLDWSQSMHAGPMLGKDSLSTYKFASAYGKYLVQQMSDYIFNNYPDSRIALLGHNSYDIGKKHEPYNCSNDPYYFNLQYDTPFVGKSEYESVILKSFDINTSPYVNDDNAQAFAAAIEKMSGKASVIYGNKLEEIPGSNPGAEVIPRELDAKRIPVIVLISDFQMTEYINKDSNNSGIGYWSEAMKFQADRFSKKYPDGILMTVRLDHENNVTQDLNFTTDVYNNLMKDYVSPAGRDGWSFTIIKKLTSVYDALANFKSILKEVVQIPMEMKVTDTIPDGLTIVSTSPLATVNGQEVTWDLTAALHGEHRLIVETTVDDPNGLEGVDIDSVEIDYENTATVSIEDKSDYNTNTTYHRLTELPEITISKTVTGDYADKTKDFTFTIYFEDKYGDKLPEDTEFTYTGNANSGTLTLDKDGKAAVKLKHGESITIEEVKVDIKVRIIETGNSGYVTSFLDSATGRVRKSNDTRFFLTTHDSRSFDFTNDKKTPPPTGISAGGTKATMLLILLPLLIFSGAVLTRKIFYRYKRT